MGCVRATVAAAHTGCLLSTAASVAARPDAVACHAEVNRGELPIWARGGVSGPRPRIPHTLGRSGRIAAILFGYPVRSPPAADRSNKILWVSRTIPAAPAALWIRAQRMETAAAIGAPVRRIVAGGPGPSIIDLPEAGCWRLILTWSGRRDSLDLAYGTSAWRRTTVVRLKPAR
jgi:hypothetical protein